MAKQITRKARSGTGLAGERISVDYHSVRLRVPPDVRIALIAASDVLRRPQWRVLVEGFLAYIGEGATLPLEKQKEIVRQARKARETSGGKGRR